MALRNNRFNAQSHSSASFPGGAEAWAVRRLDLLRNIYADQGANINDKSGVPNGYNTGARLLPLKAGGMSVYAQATALSTTNADAKMGRNLVASASLSIAVTNAQADRIVSLEGSDALSISATSAAMTAGVEASASGSLSITANLSLGGIIPVIASSSCSLTPSLNMTALAFIEASAGGPTPLSPEGLASAVWTHDISAINTTGTAGKKLNDASSSTNPWDALLTNHTTSGTFGWFIQKLLTVAKFLGLKQGL